MRNRFIASVALASLALAAVGFAADPPQPAPHPHFNDGGTLTWSKKLADAQAAAKAADKMIFIEFGREA